MTAPTPAMDTQHRSLNDLLAIHDTAIVLQARMSSSRVPGKMLREAGGRPLMEHVIARFRHAGPLDRVWLATSEESDDDPLAQCGARLGVRVYRGSLHDVAARLLGLARQEGFRALVRISADSPFMDVDVVREVMELFSPDVDLATNVGKRTFPKGQSVEVIRVSSLAAAHSEMTADDREHVTTFFYRNPHRIRMVNLDSGTSHGEVRMVVDTEDDWRRFQRAVETLGPGLDLMNWRQIMALLDGQ
ncbi:MAG: NTP transferase domain-containing protein [Verrucomicrobiaceae bacterium]|nr:NTP transferase domain-containing protein [Verrucomicrobiaceae bacterium]